MSANNARATHWLLRVMAIFVGVVFLLFGGLCAAACLSMLAQGPNAPAAAKVSTTVQIVATVIFAMIAIFGVVLIWLGARRGNAASTLLVESPGTSIATSGNSPAGAEVCEPIATGTSEPWEEVNADLGPAAAFHAAPSAPQEPRTQVTGLGEFIASCGPEKSGEMYNYVSAGVYLLLALGCVLAPSFMELKIDPGLAAKIALLPAGIGIAVAILHLWSPLFGAPQTIELYENGIVEKLGKQIRQIQLGAIEHLRLQEWYEHRFADRTLNVKARVQGQRLLSFNTALRGETDRIIEYLSSRIPQTEFVEFHA